MGVKVNREELEEMEQHLDEAVHVVDMKKLAKLMGVSVETLPVVGPPEKAQPAKISPLTKPLTDTEWRCIELYVPSRANSRISNRAFIDFCLLALRSNFSWATLKGDPSLNAEACRKRFTRWSLSDRECIWAAMYEGVKGKLSTDREEAFRLIAERGLAERERVFAMRRRQLASVRSR